MICGTNRMMLCGVLVLLAAVAAPAARADTGDTIQSRAAWMLDRMADGSLDAATGRALQRDEFGSNIAPVVPQEEGPRGIKSSPWLMLASAIVPGSGELAMGHWIRGSALLAADAFSWYQWKDAGQEGDDLEDEYYEFADAHWSEENLFEGYFASSTDLMRGGVGLVYFDLSDEDGNPISQMTSVDDLHYLSLWVSTEDDRREYYENLGKWDQFVFGWDDFRNPNAPPAGIEYTPDLTLSDLRQPWTSKNREAYRDLREKSNDAFKRQDRYLYVSLGLRVFSLLEVAYLQGWLGGGEKDAVEVAGHEVRLLATPNTGGQGLLGAQLSF